MLKKNLPPFNTVNKGSGKYEAADWIERLLNVRSVLVHCPNFLGVFETTWDRPLLPVFPRKVASDQMGECGNITPKLLGKEVLYH